MLTTIVNFVKSKISSTDLQTVAPTIENVIEQTTNQAPVQIGTDSKNSHWKAWFPFTMFFGDNEFQPIYFWITIFCSLIFFMLFIKVYNAFLAVKHGVFNSAMISTSDLGVVLGFVSSLILLYNKKGNSKTPLQSKPTIIEETKKEGDSQP